MLVSLARRSPSRGRRCEEGPIRVISADAQPLFRDALARMIRQDRDFELLAEFEDVPQLADAIQRLAPEVAVVDAGLLPQLPPPWDPGATRLLLLAAEVQPVAAYAAIEAGAAGYLCKDADAALIRRAIAAVARGETVLDPSAQTGIAQEIRLRARDERPELSAREQEILVLVAEGQSAPQIARRLHLSTATVKTHLLHLAVSCSRDIGSLKQAHRDCASILTIYPRGSVRSSDSPRSPPSLSCCPHPDTPGSSAATTPSAAQDPSHGPAPLPRPLGLPLRRRRPRRRADVRDAHGDRRRRG
jgi:two-component system nitrate/nitrite response regulator NarL